MLGTWFNEVSTVFFSVLSSLLAEVPRQREELEMVLKLSPVRSWGCGQMSLQALCRLDARQTFLKCSFGYLLK